ncbi:response regulator [Chryseolinea sp. T2]|uniref:response regulator n=1 Tax=Chryseolinea sp. T2 TaxID=3129255 RepID=UPI0030781E79
MRLPTIKTCLLINSDNEEQAIFIKAMEAVAPETFFMLATASDEAIDLLVHSDIVPDYVIIEYNMPGVDALDFLKIAKARQLVKNIPVIVHSPQPVSHMQAELLRMGAHALYLKPYNHLGVCNMLTILITHFAVNIN